MKILCRINNVVYYCKKYWYKSYPHSHNTTYHTNTLPVCNTISSLVGCLFIYFLHFIWLLYIPIDYEKKSLVEFGLVEPILLHVGIVGIWRWILWWCSFSNFSCPIYLLSSVLGLLKDQLGLIQNWWLAKRWKIDQIMFILVLERGVWRDLWCIITATDNTIGWLVMELDWIDGGESTWLKNNRKPVHLGEKKCAIYWSIGYNNKQRRKNTMILVVGLFHW